MIIQSRTRRNLRTKTHTHRHT